MTISLPFSLNICFGCSKEWSQCDGAFEYPQHMFWLKNKKVNFHMINVVRLYIYIGADLVKDYCVFS